MIDPRAQAAAPNTPEINHLVLASRSPQRRAILEQLGIPFRAVAPQVAEITAGEPRALVLENARRKARSVAGELVLAVDTVVVIDGEPFGKPDDEAAAEAVLARLSGRWHDVLGGICLRAGAREQESCATTRVRFRRLEADDVRAYVRSGEWRERAGGYAIQGRGAALVEAVEGDFWNVVGLPVAELVRLCPALLASPPDRPPLGDGRG